MIEFISQPWPWYVGGPAIGFIMLILILFGEEFGMSANLKTLCSMCGGGKVADFFRFEWKEKLWNLVVVVGAVIG
ncbi:MAG: YeeE/YedE family protein, partial [Flavobacteriales bacterium]|nr:YeeE/YedE family protein [Flavobacteriales bacterium]